MTPSVTAGGFAPIADADVPAIVALMNRAYRGVGAGPAWKTEGAYIAGSRTTEALLRAELADKPGGAFLKWVVPPGERIVGCVWLEPLDRATWYLGSFTVAPDAQGGGLGHAMLAAAEAWVRDRGGARVRMTVVNLRDTLIAWYGRRGYRDTGRIEPFPYGDDRLGTPLRDDLSFVVLEKRLA